jgi:hypothetical protein
VFFDLPTVPAVPVGKFVIIETAAVSSARISGAVVRAG